MILPALHHGGSTWDPSSAATPARSTDDFDYTGSYDTPSPAGVSVIELLCIRNAVMAVMYHNRYDIKFHVCNVDIILIIQLYTYTNPAIPGANYENPATPGNFVVDSPHGSYTNPFTPGSTRTPLYHSDYTAPSPLGSISPLTPSNSYDSPGNINPLTPGANYDGMCRHYCVTLCVCTCVCARAFLFVHAHVSA